MRLPLTALSVISIASRVPPLLARLDKEVARLSRLTLL
jgi:hypothetical protein